MTPVFGDYMEKLGIIQENAVADLEVFRQSHLLA